MLSHLSNNVLFEQLKTNLRCTPRSCGDIVSLVFETIAKVRASATVIYMQYQCICQRE